MKVLLAREVKEVEEVAVVMVHSGDVLAVFPRRCCCILERTGAGVLLGKQDHKSIWLVVVVSMYCK